MNKIPGIYLLAVALAAACFSVSAADPNIAGIWATPYSLKDPVRDFYVATSKPLGYAGKHTTSQYAYFDVWGKFVYETPEKHGDKLVAEEWVYLRLDCAKLTYTTYRYMEFDDQGNAVTDMPGTGKAKKVLLTWDDPNHLSIAESTAAAAEGDACTFDSD